MAAEKNFENKVKSFIEDCGGWYIKYWAGSKYTKEGLPDILACIDGKFYGIEIKAPNGRPKMLQLVNLLKIRKAGGIGILLYPKDFEDFKLFIRRKNYDWYLDNIAFQCEWREKLG